MSSEPLDASIIIASYTEARWEALVAAVGSAWRQEPPPLEVIVVVDHNPALFARALADLPDALVVENKGSAGLSGARNTGISFARGRYLAFLDDDAVAAPDWLARLVAWCEEPHVLGAGGRVEPQWQTGRPAWFPDEFMWVVGCTYRGVPQTASPVRNVFGGCMCVRREVFQVAGGFRSEIGRVNTVPMGCEETEFCIRARRRMPQGVFVYEPGALIHHQIPAARATLAYFRARCYSEGVSKAILTKMVGASLSLATEGMHVLRALPLGVGRGLADAIWRGDWSGLARAGAILAGLAVTGWGYLVATLLRWRWPARDYSLPEVAANPKERLS